MVQVRVVRLVVQRPVEALTLPSILALDLHVPSTSTQPLTVVAASTYKKATTPNPATPLAQAVPRIHTKAEQRRLSAAWQFIFGLKPTGARVGVFMGSG